MTSELNYVRMKLSNEAKLAVQYFLFYFYFNFKFEFLNFILKFDNYF